MIVVSKPALQQAYSLPSLPEGYVREPFVFDDKWKEWAITVTHPIYGEATVHESGYIIEMDLGYKTTLVPVTRKKFWELYEEYDSEGHRADIAINVAKSN